MLIIDITTYFLDRYNISIPICCILHIFLVVYKILFEAFLRLLILFDTFFCKCIDFLIIFCISKPLLCFIITIDLTNFESIIIWLYFYESLSQIISICISICISISICITTTKFINMELRYIFYRFPLLPTKNGFYFHFSRVILFIFIIFFWYAHNVCFKGTNFWIILYLIILW